MHSLSPGSPSRVWFENARATNTSSLLAGATLLASLFLGTACARAQSGALWREGQWALQSPGGSCGSLPLLQVKGPGSIFDSGNAALLEHLQQALPNALAGACPGAHEVILVSGRSRRLMKVGEASASVASTPSVTAPPAPISRTQTTAPIVPPRNAAMPAPLAPVAAGKDLATGPRPQRGNISPGSVATLRTASTLPSLASARETEDKCDVLLKWLESGKAESPVARIGQNLSPEMIAIFRDEPMTAVFGAAYDQTENRGRIDLYEKVFSPCLGVARPPERSIYGGYSRPRPINRAYPQEFMQYRPLIDQAFEGRPGVFEPAAILRYVAETRSQLSWGNQTMASAADVPLTREGFSQLDALRSAVNRQMSRLRPAERSIVMDYLSQKQHEVAAEVVRSVLRDATAAPRTLASAQALNTTFRGLRDVLSRLSPADAAAAQETRKRLLEESLREPLQESTAKIAKIPANAEGMPEFLQAEAAFHSQFGEFSDVSVKDAAEQEIQKNRQRIFAALLPAWQKKVASRPLDESELAALHHDMDTMFPNEATHSVPVFASYDAALSARQTQFQAKQAEEEHKRLLAAEQAAAKAAGQGSGGSASASAKTGSASKGATAQRIADVRDSALTPASLKTDGVANAQVFTDIYLGEFDKIRFERSSLTFSSVMSGYIEAFSASCRKFLPENAVALTRDVCDEYMVTRNGYGMEISRVCNSSHTEKTGVYADPVLYAASKSMALQTVSNGMRTILDAMASKDPIGGAMNTIGDSVQLQTDVASVVAQNGCSSHALRRMQDNLQRFAFGKEGMRLDGTVELGVAVLPPAPGGTYRDSNYNKLLEDMVIEQSRTWAINRYLPDTISRVSVDSRDSVGRPAKISAHYSYTGLQNRGDGSVTLSFDEGRPMCLYFSDQPSVCRTPNHRLTSAYISGGYRQ